MSERERKSACVREKRNTRRSTHRKTETNRTEDNMRTRRANGKWRRSNDEQEG